jgi:Uma2 family endonuclease
LTNLSVMCLYAILFTFHQSKVNVNKRIRIFEIEDTRKLLYLYHMLQLHEIPRYTYNDYKQWEGQWELIYGYPSAMSPSSTNLHQLVASNLHFIFTSGIRSQKKGLCNCRTLYETDWIISEDTVVRPDLCIVCGVIDPNDFIRTPPVLIAEISSNSTRLKDRNTKFRLYESLGVNYYLLVDPYKKQIEYFQLINNKYEEKTTINCFMLHNNCEITIDLSEIFE